MRTAVTVSALAHAALLAWGVYGVRASAPVSLPNLEALPIELVSLAEVTDLAKGKVDAELRKETILADPLPLPKPEPAPREELPPPVAAPAPPQIDVRPTPPVEEASLPEPAPSPEPVKPISAPPPAPVPKVVQAVPVPKPRPKPPTPPVPPVAAKDKSNFDPNRIAALIDRAAKPPSAAPDKKPSLGTATGKADAKMTESQVDALRQKINSCLRDWTVPQGWTDSAEVRSVIKFSLTQDGAVSGSPEVVERPGGQYSVTAPEAAIRQIFKCSPFKLPPELYANWRELKVTFDPKDNMSG